MRGRSIFLDTFGETPLLKVIEFFLTYPDFDYAKSSVAREAEISRVTIEKIWGSLIKKGFIVKTRTLGNADMYRLNRDNPNVRVLMKASTDLSLSYLGKLKAEEKQKVPITA